MSIQQMTIGATLETVLEAMKSEIEGWPNLLKVTTEIVGDPDSLSPHPREGRIHVQLRDEMHIDGTITYGKALNFAISEFDVVTSGYPVELVRAKLAWMYRQLGLGIDWSKARQHLMSKQSAYEQVGSIESNNILIYFIYPLHSRLIGGERTSELYQEIMQLGHAD